MHSNQSDKNRYPALSGFKRLLTILAIILVVTASAVAFSKTVHAGLFSFLSAIMGDREVSAKLLEPRTADSQISPIIVLQAAANPFQIVQASDLPPPLEEDGTTLSPDIARMNATSTENINTQISIYVVRSGDTVSTVAKMFNVSINTVLWANDIGSKATLKPGQTLVILPVTGITHTVKSGDSIESIAKRYKADVNDILNYNDLTIVSVLKTDDEIIIPNGESISASPVSSQPYGGSSPGYYSCPVPGSRLSQRLHGNNGVDLAASLGTPIRASAGGTVIINRANGAWNGGYGNFIVILHGNGTQTLYSHMSNSIVKAGETVSKNQTVGYVGVTGLTTGPHVHFEIRGAQNPFVSPALCR